MNQFMSTVGSALSGITDYLVYGAIAIVTLIGVIKCLLPLWNTTHALRRAIVHLQNNAGVTGERPVWQEPRFVGKRLRGSWLRFLQNAEQLDRRGLPCNVEDYINDDTVTHGPGNAQLAELIPSLLTSLGILGTFMGMTSGLSGLDVSSTDTMMSGIQTLLSGMQFAFGTSVAGVSCSLVFNMLNRIAQGSSYRAIDEFVDSFTQLAMQRPLDNDVQVICQNQDANHLLGTVTETLSTQMAGSIELAIGRAMQPVARSMDNFLIGATRSQIDGVNNIVDSFVRRMNDALNGQFMVLGRTLADFNQSQRVSVDQLNQALAAASGMLGEVNRIHGVSQDVISHFEHYVAELGESNRRDERFEQSAAELLGKLRQAGEQQLTTIGRLQTAQEQLNREMAQFSRTTRETVDGIGRLNKDAALNLADVNKSMRLASDKLTHSYQDFVQNMVEGLSHAMGGFETTMKDLLTALQGKIDTLNAAGTDGVTAAQVSELQRTCAAMHKTLEDAVQAVTPKED